jgi:hypothetical protein
MKKLYIKIKANKKAVIVAVIGFFTSLGLLNTDQADRLFKWLHTLCF